MTSRALEHGMRIAVTGATGKTGMCVVRRLRQMGAATVALVHREDERSESLRACGADVLCGDFDDAGSIRELLRDASAAYLCLPPDAELLARTERVATASRGSGLRRIVNMSQLHVAAEHESPLTALHWEAERRLDRSGVAVTHLRSTFFAEGYLILGAGMLRGDAVLPLPFGTGRVAPISCSDIGRVAAAILTAPNRDWESIYTPTGRDLLDHDAIARVLSALTGHRITYLDVPADVWRARAVDEGFPPFLADHFAATAACIKQGTFARVTDVVQSIAGAAPIRFADALAEGMRLFGAPSERIRA
jgi:NAD(P)H dehydrogenase (quinone)